ncbi:kinase-like domain-containing protein [Rhizophagus irregularis DAOM 181602=DAOM 197198]|nr:kinase-like domain-containing protein [Rhizophagus irregularis DAOM 181602=DAOM 197198]
MQDTKNKNEWIKWIEEAIDEEHIKYYEYKEFNNFQEIGTGGFGKVYRANWKNLEKCFAVKSFFSLDNIAVKEIIRELKNQREVDYHDNIIRCHGITKFESTEYHVSNNYMLVMEYANNGSLRSYLEKNFSKLTWDEKYIMAYQLACAVSCLHNEGIVHRDLHSGEGYDVGLALEILQGLRETIVPDTPENYVKIYTKCWDGEPDNREQEINDASNTNNSESQGDLSQLIQDFNKMNTKEIDSMVVLSKQKNLTTEKDFNRLIDEISDFIYKLSNKGTAWKLIKRQFIEYLNTQYFVGHCYLYGTGTTKNEKLVFEYFEKVANKNFARGQLGIGYYCYEYGIAMRNLSYCYIAESSVEKDYNKAFELSKKSAEGGDLGGITLLGYCYNYDCKHDDNALKTLD